MKINLLLLLLILSQTISAQVFTEISDTPFDGVYLSAIGFSDVDGDGSEDILITGGININERISKLYVNDGQGNFEEMEGSSFAGVWSGSVAFSDIDGDDDEDVLIVGQGDINEDLYTAKLYTNDGEGSFTEMIGTPFIGVSGGSAAFSDINGDGYEDVLISGNQGLMLYTKLYVNDGVGNFTEIFNTPFAQVFGGSIVFSDVNEDGYNDVLISGNLGNGTMITNLYINDGLGNFTEMANTPFEGVWRSSISFSDVNGNGYEDVLITGLTSSNSSSAGLYINDGQGVFTKQDESPFDGVARSSIAFSDVNGNGHSDVLITGVNNVPERIAKLYINDGLGNFNEFIDTPFEGVEHSSIAFSDLNGDGFNDVLITGINNVGNVIAKQYNGEMSSLFLPGNDCIEANDINSLFGQPLGEPQISEINDNTFYTSTDNDPISGIECFESEGLENTIWYTFIGDGKTYNIKTVECNASNYIAGGNTQMAIYSGDCGNYNPVACNEDEDSSNGNFNSNLNVPTETGVTYYVMIDGAENEVGEYCVQVTFSELTVPGNDCIEANDISSLFGQALGEPQISEINDNTFYTSTDNDPTSGIECFENENLENTVWYTFIGDGKTYNIKTVECNASNYIAGGNTQMAIYTGDCGNYNPVGCNDDEDSNNGNFNSNLNVPTESGVTYYVMIDGAENEVGEYCVQVTFSELTVPGNDCIEANDISSLFGQPLGEPQISEINDNTFYTSTDNDPTSGIECFENENLENTVWYTFIGDGKTYNIKTIECNASNYIAGGNTQMAIYTGDCGNYNPVGCNDDEDSNNGNFNSNLNVPTETGVTYYVMIDGADNAVGEYCLQVTFSELTVPGNDCTEANDINSLFGQALGEPQISEINDNTFYTSTDDDPTSGIECFENENLENTVWYTFIGDGKTYNIKTVKCNASNYIAEGNTQMAIYSGDCGNYNPVGCNEDEDIINGNLNSNLNVPTESGVTYYVMIDGEDNAVGEYCLQVTFSELTVPGNDCIEANDISSLFGQPLGEPQISEINDNTFYTSTDNDPISGIECFESEGLENTIWYTFIGDGKTYNIKTVKCNASNYIAEGNTQMAIYTGDCGNYNPVGCNDDEDIMNGNLNSNLNVSTESGVTYYVMIDGAENEVGEYCVEVTFIEPNNVPKTEVVNIKLYPNPTSSEITLHNINADVVEIYNNLGVMVKRYESPGNKLDISNIANGIYIVKIRTGEELSTSIIIKY